MAIFARFVRYFDEVARRSSIRSAAERLHIASSAIDRQILKAEKEFDVPLFERLPQGMRLTAAGEHLITHVRRWRREYEQVKAQIENLRGLHGGRVTVALPETLAGDLVARHLGTFHQRYPRVTLLVRVAGINVPDLVVAGDADLGLTFTSTANRSLRVERTLHLRLGVAVRPGHPLAKRKHVHLRECLAYPLIVPDEGKMLRNAIDTGFARQGLELKPAVVSENFSIMRAMVTRGLGIAMLTRIDVIREVEQGELIFVPFADRGLPQSVLSLVTGPHPSVVAAQLAQWLAQAIDGLEID